MFMLLSAKRMAFLGLLLAFAVLLVVISGILEMSTLFLLAGASFCVGIAIRETGFRMGVGFLIASALLSFILAPNKFYCFTFVGMGLYLVIIEFAWEKLAAMNGKRNRNARLWIIKFVTFNLIYIPTILLLPQFIFPGNISRGLLVVAILGGQLILVIYDQAYRYFQKTIWGKLRGYLHLKG